MASTRYGYSDRIPSDKALIVSAKSTDINRLDWASVLQYVDGVVVYNCGSLDLSDGTRKYLGVPARANSYIRVRFGDSGVYPLGDTLSGEAQVEFGSSAMTAYEPYEGEPKSISLGQTVYGGTLEVMSGKLTSFPYYSSYNGQTLRGRWICDRAVYSQGTTPPTGSQVVDMSGNGTEITLTPTQVKTLLGNNNIWADSGSVEVEYRADTTLAYNELLAMILENTGN